MTCFTTKGNTTKSAGDKLIHVPSLLIKTYFFVALLAAFGASSVAAQDVSEARASNPGGFQSLLAHDGSVEALQTPVSVHFDGVTLADALAEIAGKSGLGLSYSSDTVPVDRLISLQIEEASVAEALEALIANTSLKVLVTEGGEIVIVEGVDEKKGSDLIAISRRAVMSPLQISQPKQLVPAMQHEVRGRVTDAETGESLPGVNVVVEGTTTGTTTDAEGEYELTVSSDDVVLSFSFVGYQTVEVPVDGRSEINIEMASDVRLLEDLVVVAYGTQERINLTGAVDQVSGDDLANRPISNVTQGLQGVMPNVNIDMLDGKPIQAPSINIRGATSIGQGGNALVLIDGVEGDPSMLNPRDIESISVLKDASSAAAYGARGAFGVVLITTKDPETDQLSVSYSGSMGMNSPTVNQSQYVTDGLQWGNMFVESFENWEGTSPRAANKSLPFSEDYLREVERRIGDPSLDRTWVADDGTYRYAHSTDWFGHLFKSNTLTTDHNLSVSGSTENVSFMVSGRAQHQEGLIRLNPDDYQLLNLRGRGIVDVAEWLQVSNSFDVSHRTYFNPMNCCDAQYAQLDIALEGFPLAPLYNPDGTLTQSGAYALGGYAEGYNGIGLERSLLRNKAEAEARVLDDRLSVIGDFSFQRTLEEREQKRVPVAFSRGPGIEESIGSATNWLRIDNNKTDFIATNLYSEYRDLFLDLHDVAVTVGANYEESTATRVATRRDGLIFPGAQDLNLALGEDIDTAGGYEKWAILGGFYRLNYIFDDRYLLELSGRYDGSSKFPEHERFAFFPSASAGWRISSEPFWGVPESVINHLQLRASYGSMGNGNISSYVFHETFNISRSGRILDGTRPRQTSNPGVLPDGLTWETVTTANVGLDLSMLDDRLQFTGDAYIRETTDMFTRALTPPATFGAAPPLGNYADLRTTGWELDLSWQDEFGLAGRPLNYNVQFTLADNQAVITRYNNPDKFLNDYYEGMVLGEIWGFETEGFFESEEDVANHADQSIYRSTSWGEFRPGDIKLRDLTGDGEISLGENTADNPGDRRIIGNSNPRYRFGVNMGAEWRGVSVSMFFQGIGQRDWYPSNEANFWGQYNRPYNHIPAWHVDEGIIWSEENPDSFFPRYVSRIASSGNGILRQAQTGYLMNSAYVRLQNLQVGYNLPERLFSQIDLQNARIYFSGENLWSWSPLYRIADNLDVENQVSRSDEMARPGETIRQGYNYPMMRSLTMGLSLTF